MPSDVELRRIAQELHRLNQLVEKLIKETARGNQAAEERSRRAEEAGLSRGRPADWAAGSGSGQSEEGLRQGAPAPRTPEELAQEYEAKRPNHEF